MNIKHLFMTAAVGANSLTVHSQSVPVPVNFKSYNAGQAFTCITVDSSNNIWAGTSKAGLFLLDKKANPNAASFGVAPGASAVSAFVLQTLAADKLGNVWVGHSGGGTTAAAGGGVEQVDIQTKTILKHYAPDRNSKGLSFLERDGLATLNTKSITVDINNTVWTAHRYHDVTSPPDYILTPGAMSYKRSNAVKFTTVGGYQGQRYPEWPYPAYTYNPTASQTPQSRTCYSIASDSNEVWISVAAYTYADWVAPLMGSIPSRILRYSLDGTFRGVINFETIGIPIGGIFNGLYLSPKHDAWVTTTAGKGFAVRRNGNWTYMNPANLSCIIPAGTVFNDNAIWGNKFGNVFIGTSNGLIVYNGRGPVNVSASYTFYSKATQPAMASNNIKGGFSEKDSIQWMATDNGIMSVVLGRYSAADSNATSYKSCNNPDINHIEELLNTPAIKRDRSYHIYKVETEICAVESNPNCTAESIYKMMKDDVTFAAVTPYDFPLDGLTIEFMDALTVNDLVALQNNVNAWKASSSPNSDITLGEIKTIADVVPRSELKEMLNGEGDWYQGAAYEIGQFLSLGYFGSLIPRKVVYDRQMAVNDKKLVSCKKYLLYNAPNYIQDRHVFSSGNNIFWGLGRVVSGCDTGNIENATYDPIFSVGNDLNYTVTNYTAKGHMLYPGKITRQVVEECGKVKMVTIGEGVQFCGDNTAGKRNAYGNVVVGCILFKNIDFRLSKAFKDLK